MENPAILAKSAKIAIALQTTSAMIDSISLGVPTIQYCLDNKRLYEDFPDGTNLKTLGFHEAVNELDLEKFADEVITGKYTIPPVFKRISSKRDLEFLEYK